SDIGGPNQAARGMPLKVALGEIKNEFNLTLTGDEPWLSRIYADFAKENRGAIDAAKITGSVRLIVEPAGTLKVSGRLAYQPTLPCGRCDKPLLWPLDLVLDARFFEPRPDEFSEKDKNLS